MTAAWNYLATAEGLVRYFGSQTKAPGDVWAKGQAAAEAWVDVLRSDPVDPAALIRVDALMLEGSGDTGSGWQELLMAYDSWRESR